MTLPSTPTIRVVYTRADSKGTNYGHIIPNPKSIDEVFRVMLFTKQTPAYRIVRLEPITPLKRQFSYSRLG